MCRPLRPHGTELTRSQRAPCPCLHCTQQAVSNSSSWASDSASQGSAHSPGTSYPKTRAGCQHSTVGETQFCKLTGAAHGDQDADTLSGLHLGTHFWELTQVKLKNAATRLQVACCDKHAHIEGSDAWKWSESGVKWAAPSWGTSSMRPLDLKLIRLVGSEPLKEQMRAPWEAPTQTLVWGVKAALSLASEYSSTGASNPPVFR